MLIGCDRDQTQTLPRQTYTVERRPFDVTIGLAGTISPAAKDEIVMPFDGVIQSVTTEFGQPVSAGDVLFIVGAGELIERLREAQSELLKFSQNDADTLDWEASGDVARARRGIASAEAALKSLDTRIATTKGLLDRGLVARDEYEGLVEQRKTGELALASAQDDLAAARKKGSPAARQIAQLDLLNARAKLTDLQDQLAHARIVAPAEGVLVRPVAARAEDANAGLRPGAHLQRGQVMAEVARAADLAVTVRLNEADVNKVREGMSATVTGPGFPGLVLSGRVTNVARQAITSEGLPGAGAGDVASFPATIDLGPLAPSQSREVRIGMTANVILDIHHEDAALVVPAQAVQGGASSATVMVTDPRTKRLSARSVAVGEVTPDGVEITSGIKPGDVVTWQAGAPIVPTT